MMSRSTAGITALIVALVLTLGLAASPALASAVVDPLDGLQPVPHPDIPVTTPPPTLTPENPAQLAGKPWERWLSTLMLAAAPVIVLVLWWGNVIRPKPLAARGMKPPQTPWWTLVASAFLVYFAAQLGGALGHAALPWPRDLADNFTKGKAVITLGYYSLGLAAAVVLVRLSLSDKRLAVGNARDAALGLGLFLLAYPVVAASAYLSRLIARDLFSQDVSHLAHSTLRLLDDRPTDPWVLVLTAAAVLAAPIFEEIVFRFFLQSAALAATTRPWTSILITSLPFAAIHLPGGTVPPHALVPLLVLSLAMGLAYHRTGKLVVPIAMHAAFNALNIALALTL